MPSSRSVEFQIYQADRLLLEGQFTATKKQTTSFFGPRWRLLQGQGVHTASIEHDMHPDGSIGLTLTLYSGGNVLLTAGVSVGSESGEDEEDSVMLGPDYLLVFRTCTVA